MSSTNRAPAASQSGRPEGNSPLSTQSEKGSVTTGASSIHPVAVAQGLPVGIGHPRGDAIDGCRHEAHPVGQPGGDRGRSTRSANSRERGPDHAAVVGDVVARDDRERWRAGAATAVERQRDAAERGRRRGRPRRAAAQQLDVVAHVGVVGVEPPVAVEPVAGLGDGEREDDHVRIRERRDERGDVVARRHPHDARHDLRVGRRPRRAG